MYKAPGILLLSKSKDLEKALKRKFPDLAVQRVLPKPRIIIEENLDQTIFVVDSDQLEGFLELTQPLGLKEAVRESSLVIESHPLTGPQKLKCYENGIFHVGKNPDKDPKCIQKMEWLISKKGSLISHQFLRDRLNHEYHEQKQQIQELNELLQMAVHDLRSPLSAMVCYSELLMDGVLDKIKGTNSNPIHIIHQNCEFLIDMVDDLLDSAQLEAGKKNLKLVRTNFNNIVKKVVRSLDGLARVKDIQIRTDLADIPDLYVDPQKMERIVINLLGNAIKFTKAGGTIKMRSSHIENDMIFSIQDMGPGIPESDLENIFEKFNIGEASKISGKGHGLGLAITKSFVEMHGGKIYVKSERHKGSTFVVQLNVERRVSRSHRSPDKKILLIDVVEDIPDLKALSHINSHEIVRMALKPGESIDPGDNKYAAVIINEKFNYGALGQSIFKGMINMKLKHIPWFFLVPALIQKEDLELYEFMNIHILKKPVSLAFLREQVKNHINRDRRKI